MNIVHSHKYLTKLFAGIMLLCLLTLNFASMPAKADQAEPPPPPPQSSHSNEPVEAACEPSISFTTVPLIGSTNNLKGRVDCVTAPASNYKVAVFIYMDGWFNKPYFENPPQNKYSLTPIIGEGTSGIWETDIVTSTNDLDPLATKIAAFLVPGNFDPNTIQTYGGPPTLPEILFDSEFPHVMVDRRKTIEFDGYTWRVNVTALGPDEYSTHPGHCGRDSDYNYFSDAASDVWVDEVDGIEYLHLTITERDGKWYSTEIVTDAPLGYGIYSFTLADPPLNLLDQNAVLEFFSRDDSVRGGSDGQIDVELSWRGDTSNNNSRYKLIEEVKKEFDTPSAVSTHGFKWLRDQIDFISYEGSPPTLGPEIARLQYTGADIPLHEDEHYAGFGLWLDGCKNPLSGKRVEVVIKSFDFDDLTLPSVKSITRLDPSPTSATSVNFKVTFSESVDGVDIDDFSLSHDSVSDAMVDEVLPAKGPSSTYTVSVNTGSGNGIIRLDLDDNDSIVDGVGNPLGGPGTGNGDFNQGEKYTIHKVVNPGTYDDISPPWTYTDNDNWNTYTGSGPYNNTLSYTSTPGDSAEISFTGTQFTLIYTQHTNRGKIDVYVDGVKVDTIDAKGRTVWQQSWTSDPYPLGEHTVRFVHAGEEGTYIDIDAIEILGPDTTEPAPIDDLQADPGTCGGTVDLSWTAVGDDDTNGTASAYLVRYSTSAINNETDWNSATVFANTLTPKAAGGAESLTVTGLTPGTTYFFAVRAQDEVPNLGGLSNSPSALPPDKIVVSPGTYDDTHPAWCYTGSWSVHSGVGPHNNTLSYTSTPGDSAEISFNGTQFTLIYTQHTNRGLIDVYVDDVKVETIDANGPTVWQQSWESAIYPLGDHTVRFVHAGEEGTYIDVDAIEILGPDTTAPAPIDDLQAAPGTCGGTVDLTWTAVGDDGTNGTASNYLVRYSTSAINDETDWNSATLFANSLTPKPAGQTESMTVTGLSSDTTYYFSVRAQDEVPNLGDLPNSPGAVPPDKIVVSPGTYDDTHPAWCYAESWSVYNGPGPYNNTLHFTSTPGDSAEISFNGTQFTLIYTQHTNRGKIDVYVDDVKVYTIDANGPTVWQQSWMSATYALGDHTVRFVHAGGGAYIDVDAIEILGPDTTAPAPIDDLQAAPGICGGTVDLSWTAVGDDGTNGTTSNYLVRYSTSAINNDTDWNNATVFANNLTPKAAGGAESLTVTGLSSDTTYYFSVRAQDEVPNLGDLSNSPSAMPPDKIVVSPGTYDDTHPAWCYTGSWSVYIGPGPYNNTLHYTSTVGDYAEITFTGTQFIYKYLQYINRGLLDVFVDGVKVDTINARGTTTWQKSWTSASYPLGEHTVRFVHAGGGTYIDIDVIEILGPDVTAPAAISDLNAVTGGAGGSVDLSWTAVGDDGGTGTATSYLVRYSTSAINNDTDWNNATVFANTLTPKAAGSVESLTVTGLTPGTTYFFAVRAQDEVPNLSGLSNSPSAAAKVPSPPVGAGLYDNTDAAWVYNGAWTAYSGAGPYNNSLSYTSTVGNYAEITFTGTQFTLKYTQHTNRGLIDVYVDGVKVDTINAYGTTTWQKSWTSASYALDDHTVRFVHAGGGTYIDIDAIEILP